MTAISQLTALAVAPANNDLIPITDISDTTQSANGTTKKIAVSDFLGNSVKQPSIINVLDPPFSGIAARGMGYIESTGAGTRKPVLRYWTFDPTTAQAATGKFTVPQTFTTAVLKIPFFMSSANVSKNVGWVAYVRAISDGDTLVLAKVYAAANTGTTVCPDAAGTVKVASITLTNMDSLANKDQAEIWLERDTGIASNAAGNANVLECIWIEYS